MTWQDELRQQAVELDAIRGAVITKFRTMARVALAASLLIEYRCRRKNCLLFQACRAPDGDLWYMPRYKLEVSRNLATSSADGRRLNTSDGNRRWNDQGGRIEWMREWRQDLPFDVNCDHVNASVPVSEILSDLAKARPGEPTRRSF